MFKLSALTVVAALSSVSAFANCPNLAGTYIQCDVKSSEVANDIERFTFLQSADSSGIVTYKTDVTHKDGSSKNQTWIADGKTYSETNPEDGSTRKIKTSCGPNELFIEETVEAFGQTMTALSTFVMSSTDELELYLNLENQTGRGALALVCKKK